ncbi:hypothetical protein BDQ12DRAFT_713322 [Crucibulum laeve]|uniref:Uncharacterized protein n=1 Tax=Crucibulum laeve TaxID=68775 RepID=A0A5C3LY70_9AGAR|nr:hypothetical protein BDQ12DRAFT_713322 [Crucibulum laeve]
MDDQGTFTIPETFWSTDPCGNYRMSESELIRIGLVPPRIDIIPIVMQIGHNFHTSMLDYLAAFYHAQGLDLLSNATVFQLLNLPIVEDLGILKPLRKMPKLLISGLGIDQRKAQDDLELFLGGLPIDHANGLRHSTRCHLERNYCQILHRQKLKAATTACYDLADCGPLRRRILNERFRLDDIEETVNVENGEGPRYHARTTSGLSGTPLVSLFNLTARISKYSSLTIHEDYCTITTKCSITHNNDL